MTCPVVKALTEIRGGWLGAGTDGEDHSTKVIKIGGAGGVEYVNDNVAYYITSRKISLARLRLQMRSGQSSARLPAAVVQFAHLNGKKYKEIFMHLVNHVVRRHYLLDQLVGLIDLINQLEIIVSIKSAELARQNQPTNISLCSLVIPPEYTAAVTYNPAALYIVARHIITYINKMNLNSISAAETAAPPRMEAPIAPDELSAEIANFADKQAPQFDLNVTASPEQLLSQLEELLRHEEIVAEVVQKMEKYQCEVINKLNPAYDIIVGVLNGMTTAPAAH